MNTLPKAASATPVLSTSAIALVCIPDPRLMPVPSSTPIDYTGPNVYMLDWRTIYPGNRFYNGSFMPPGSFSVHSLRDALQWAKSMPGGTILLCSR
jgi:hypothetical protein